MKKKKIIATVIEIVLLLAIVVVLVTTVNKKTEPTTAYVYAQDAIEKGTTLGPNVVKEVQVPKSVITNNFVTSIEEMKGKAVKNDMHKGEFVYKTQLINSKEDEILSSIDWTTHRTFTLSVEADCLGEIKRGQKVDLIYVGPGVSNDVSYYANKDDEEVVYSRTFMQDVIVCKTSLDTSEDETPEEQDKKQQENKKKIKVTFALTLDQIEEILARKEVGDIKLAVRDKDSQDYNTLGYIMGDYVKKFTGNGNGETGRTVIQENL